jgi:hypothetical protein
MADGLVDVVSQRHRIDGSYAAEAFKRIRRRKLDVYGSVTLRVFGSAVWTEPSGRVCHVVLPIPDPQLNSPARRIRLRPWMLNGSPKVPAKIICAATSAAFLPVSKKLPYGQGRDHPLVAQGSARPSLSSVRRGLRGDKKTAPRERGFWLPGECSPAEGGDLAA